MDVQITPRSLCSGALHVRDLGAARRERRTNGDVNAMALSNRSLAAGAALLLVGSLAPLLKAPPQRVAELGVRRALIRLNELLGRRDIAIVDEFVPADDALLIGAEAGDVARGPAEIEAFVKRLFAQPETISWAWRRVEVSVLGEAAWVFAEGEVVRRGDDSDRRQPYRLTGLLEPRGGRWLWRTFHGSQPAA
jgi:ketosteroid isomerase-like protein